VHKTYGDWENPGKVGGPLLGHVDDVLLDGDLVVGGVQVAEGDAVAVEQLSHFIALLAADSDARQTQHVLHHLAEHQVQRQRVAQRLVRRKHLKQKTRDFSTGFKQI